MADEAMATTEELQEQFTAARLSGNHEAMEAIGRRLYPSHADAQPAREGGQWTENFAANLTEKYRVKEDGAKGAGRLTLTRAELEARVAELRVGPFLETAHRREARLADLVQAQRELYEGRAATAPRPDPAAEREPGVTPINWGSAPEGEVWDVPARDAIGAHFVKGGIAVADLERWAGEDGPDEAPDMPRAVIADARLAVQTKLPADPIMREKAMEFIEVRRLHNSPAFLEWAAAIGRTVREELQQANADRLALAGMNAGSPQYEATKASLDAHYRKAHGGS